MSLTWTVSRILSNTCPVQTPREKKGVAETQLWIFRHDLFQRDKPHLHALIRRKANDAAGSKGLGQPPTEPSLMSKTRSLAPSSSSPAGSDLISQLLHRVQWLENELRETREEVARNKQLLVAICHEREISKSRTVDNEHAQVAYIRENTECLHFGPSPSDYPRQGGHPQASSTDPYTPASTSPTVRVSPPSTYWNSPAYAPTPHADTRFIGPRGSSVSPTISTLPIRRSPSPGRHAPYQHRPSKSDSQAHPSHRRNGHTQSQSLSIPGMPDPALLPPPPLQLNETLGGTQQQSIQLGFNLQQDLQFAPSTFDPGSFTFQLAGPEVDTNLTGTTPQHLAQAGEMFGDFSSYTTTASTTPFDTPSTQLGPNAYDHITNWPVNVVPHRSRQQDVPYPSRPGGSDPIRSR